MHLSEERIYYLLRSYTDNKTTEAEEQELYAWAAEEPDDMKWKAYMVEMIRQEEGTFNQVDWDNLYRRIKRDISKHRALRSVKRNSRLRVAVSLLILMLGGGYLIGTQTQRSPAPTEEVSVEPFYHNDIKPGRHTAMLQSGDESVWLSGVDTSFMLAGNQVRIDHGDVHIRKGKPARFTLIVPRGGTYRTILADGTQVWLNADSRLTYPSVFTGSRREVTLSGEAYFEVHQDAEHPFIVQLPAASDRREREVEVLGTAFNVAAYPGEQEAMATLVSGKVSVRSQHKEVVLLPGQQVMMTPKGQLDVNPDADVEQAVAWKNGYFRFNRADIHTIMDQLSRWYDIQVQYAADLQSHHFGAIISRNNNISGILKMLEATGDVHFKIDGKEVTVMP